MFITRFTRTDNDVEDFLYNTLQEAKTHLLLFVDDTSELYRNIAVLDGDNNVLIILPFENGKPLDVISAGSLVKLRTKFSSAEEIKRADVFVITNMNECLGRCNIACLTTNMVFKPIETVGVETVYPLDNNTTSLNILTEDKSTC